MIRQIFKPRLVSNGTLRAFVSYLLSVLLVLAAPPVSAQETEVDLELVLMVDVSRSMSDAELELQRRGYAEALRSDVVFRAVQSGLLQTLALTYVEWAGTQEIIVDWQLIETRQDLDSFADQLTVRSNPSLRRTSISSALEFGASRILRNAYRGLRRVIDISGDGPNNLGPLVLTSRDRVTAQGITINGLPLMTNDGAPQLFHLENLDVYYQTCVIGGPGAFAIPVYVWRDFSAAVQRKLVLEIAGLMPQPQMIKAQARDPRDCQVGEKIWEDFMQGNGFIP
ncbi:DUF1194 domain containing protein [Sulfitobacter noctilucae]|uniref:DUF1194 domain-containing protein n=1 Tax=Sulfitobacter noctilucae TaxID=1342302 RepID=UPI0004695B6D|nr:DUF1194 domain-containing protein [Sulfitobacter noctilucae]KIN75307.1 DUF1194 domain containing protein [Sulfitobacter noctilucae]